nr:conjugal transfer protein TraN [Croceicoccus hydrothermalis]
MAARSAAMVIAFVCSSVALGQAMQDAREEGEALAETLRDATSGTILGDAAPDAVPGFGGTTFSETDLADDPDGLSDIGELQRHTNPSYGVVIDTSRPTFDPTTIDLSSAQLVEKDPDAYLGTDVDLGGSSGSCEPLPGGNTGASDYFESCNDGTSAAEFPLTCSVVRQVQVTAEHRYSCQSVDIVIPEKTECNRNGCTTTPEQIVETISTCTSAEADSSCRLTGTSHSADGPHYIYGRLDQYLRLGKVETRSYTCAAEHNPLPAVQSSTPYYTRFLSRFTRPDLTSEQHWHAAAERYDGAVNVSATSSINESDCQTKTASLTCNNPVEVCVDASPQTRMVNGVAVTHSCWRWERTYQCGSFEQKNDCSALEANSSCTYDRRECLSENSDGTCNLWDIWYRCTTGSNGNTSGPEFVCAGDLYCIDGECTPVERQASTEFKDAMVAVQTMGEFRDDFDPDTLRLFTGEDLKCTRKVFGISNCCSGKGVPLITPWLCDSEDRLVDQKDDEGLCHYVGTYCSDKILGVCVTRKQSYCCFSSKLTRILQEQGRAQLGMSWGSAKEPSCDGFLVAQFQQLDLSQMDFSEVYDEFVEAARLPDEIEAGVLIQERIAQYYDLHTSP